MGREKWPVSFTEASAVVAISNLVPWSGDGKLHIFDIIHRDSVKNFGALRFTPRMASAAQGKCEVKWTPERTLLLHLTFNASNPVHVGALEKLFAMVMFEWYIK